MQRLGAEFFTRTAQDFPTTRGLLEWLTKDGHFKLRMQKHVYLDKIYNKELNIDKGFGIRAAQDINANEEIFLVSASNSITGLELVGCDRIKSFEINSIVSKIASKYYEKNLPQLYYTQNLLKIICQVFVHNTSDQMSLHPFANYLIKSFKEQQIKNPLFYSPQIIKGIYSSNLASTISSTRSQLRTMSDDLASNRMFGISVDEFVEMLSIVRSRNLNFTPEDPKYFDMNSVVILSPVVDWINHSFEANCRLFGSYFQHESESFVVVKASKDIKKGEELTINYGNLNNLDYLMRYGFVNEQNPYNELAVHLNFDDCLEYTSELFDFKQKVFRTQEDFTLERFVLHENRVNRNLLRTLRIYFLRNSDLLTNPKLASFTFKDFDEKVSDENEKAICNFMIKFLQAELKKYEQNRLQTLDFQQISHPERPGDIINLNNHSELKFIQNPNYRNMLHICISEQVCIQKNVAYFEKILGTLRS